MGDQYAAVPETRLTVPNESDVGEKGASLFDAISDGVVENVYRFMSDSSSLQVWR